jgi:hypothetical protein
MHVCVVGGLGQHTSLGIVGLCASGNTLLCIAVGLCGVLLLVMLYLGQHTLLGHFFWFMRGLEQNTLLGIVEGYVTFRATRFTGHHLHLV